MLDRDTVQALRSASRVALTAFVDEANRTHAIFDGIENAPEISNEHLIRMLEQRQSENEAFERYQQTRLALFRVAKRE